MKNLLEEFLKIRNATTDLKYEGQKLDGEIILNDELLHSIKVLHEKDLVRLIKVDQNLSSVPKLKIGDKVTFKITAPKQYFEDFDELLKKHPVEPPEGFKVYNTGDEDKYLGKYKEIQLFFDILKRISITRDGTTLTLFAGTKVVIPCSYQKTDMKTLAGIQELHQLIIEDSSNGNGILKDVVANLLNHAICEEAANLNELDRFRLLLNRFDQVYYRYKLAYRCFTNQASKLAEKFDESRSNVISALNGILGNIQTTLVGVPLTSMLALKEFDYQAANLGSFKNWIITIGIIFITSTLTGIVNSQQVGVEAVEDEIKIIESELTSLKADTDDTSIRRMTSRLNYTKILLTLAQIVSLFILLVVLLVLLYNPWCDYLYKGGSVMLVWTIPALYVIGFVVFWVGPQLCQRVKKA